MKVKHFLLFSGRNDWIDVLRGLSILLVLVTHGFLNLKFIGLDFILPKKNFDILRSNGYLGVSMFFTISGFLISKQLLSPPKKSSKKSNKLSNLSYFQNFYIKRLSRILPPLLFLFFIGLLLNISSSNVFVDFQVDPFSLFFVAFIHAISFTYNFFYLGDGGSTLGLRPYIPLWSLSIEEIYYLIYPILLKFFLKSKIWLSFFLVALTIISPIYRFTHGNISVYHLLGCCDMLALGGLAYIFPKFQFLQKIANPFSLILILVAIFVCLSTIDVHVHYVLAPSLIGFLAFLFLVFSDLQKRVISPSPIRKISFVFRLFGVLTYEIYLFHLMFFILFWRIDYDYSHNYLSSPIPLSALLLFSLLCHIKIFEPIRIRIKSKYYS